MTTISNETLMPIYDGLHEISCFEAGEDLVPGFVMLSGADFKLYQAGALASGDTRLPIGVVSASYTSGDEAVSVLDKGVIGMVAAVACSAGDPVYASATAGKFVITVDSGVVAEPIATVIKGAAQDATALIKFK